ncbi:MAG: hypothetical protein AB1813_15145 [Verrucomicrobiota bacterium]
MRDKRICFAGIALAILAAWKAHGAALDDWTLAFPLHGQISQVTFGNDTFVAVGERGTILNSSNTEQWIPSHVPARYQLFGVTYRESLFVAVGSANKGVILTSVDGRAWTERFLNGGGLFAVAHGNGRFVAVGQAGTIVYSDDGLLWHPTTSPVTSTMFDLVYGNGVFVAVGGTSAEPLILSSADGKSWTAQTVANDSPLWGVAFGNGKFCAVGGLDKVWVSESGVTWTRTALPAGLAIMDVTFGNGEFLAVGAHGAVLHSTDLISWTTDQSPVSEEVRHVDFSNSHFFAVTTTSRFFRSSDGTQWVEVASPRVQENLFSVAAGHNRFVAVGEDGYTLTSGETHEWTAQPLRAGQHLYSVHFVNGQFIAGGMQQLGSDHFLLFWSSADGLNWTRRSVLGPGVILSVTHGQGKYVAVASEPDFNSQFWISTDAENWTRGSGIAGHDLQVRFEAGQFFAFGSPGAIWSSPNANDWVLRASFPFGEFRDLVRVHGMLVAAGPRIAAVSHDGLSWTSARLNLDLQALAPAGNQVLAIHAGSRPAVYSSTDGLNWLPRNDGLVVPIDLVNLNGRFVALTHSALFQAIQPEIQFLSPILRSGGTEIVFQLTATDGTQVTVETSTNLVDWEFFKLFQNAPFEFAEPTRGARFFRARVSGQ